MKYSSLILTITLVFFLSTKSAHAYLDPGTGSILIQGLIAAIAGGLFTIRLYWQKVKSFFSKNTETNEETKENPNLDEDNVSK